MSAQRRGDRGGAPRRAFHYMNLARFRIIRPFIAIATICCGPLAAPGAPGQKPVLQKSEIESVTGPVTPSEIASFKAAIAELVPGETNNHNSYSYGYN